jgi:hypothetical protein
MTKSPYYDLMYVLAGIYPETIVQKEIYEDLLYAKIFLISDANITPDDFSETEEYLSSYFIILLEDGEWTTANKLYKLEGLFNPKIIEIKATKYPNFTIKIEYGILGEKKVKTFNFDGI